MEKIKRKTIILFTNNWLLSHFSIAAHHETLFQTTRIMPACQSEPCPFYGNYTKTGYNTLQLIITVEQGSHPNYRYVVPVSWLSFLGGILPIADS